MIYNFLPVLLFSIPVLGKITQEVKFIFEYPLSIFKTFPPILVSPCLPPLLYGQWLNAFNTSNSPYPQDLLLLGYLLEGFTSSHIRMPYVLFAQAQHSLTDTTVGFDLMANFWGGCSNLILNLWILCLLTGPLVTNFHTCYE